MRTNNAFAVLKRCWAIVFVDLHHVGLKKFVLHHPDNPGLPSIRETGGAPKRPQNCQKGYNGTVTIICIN